MIDNTDTIKKWLHFELEGDVYFLQIMERGKDTGGRDRVVKEYHIHNIEQLDKELPGIKEICDATHARAMIRLNQRNTLDANIEASIEAFRLQREVNRVMRKMIRTGRTNLKLPKINSVAKLYSSALGSTCSESSETKKWILDIDTVMIDAKKPGFGSLDEIAKTFTDFIVAKCHNKRAVPVIYGTIPSKSGLHLVVSPFRKDKFLEHFGKPASQCEYIMTDANTNLYIPD